MYNYVCISFTYGSMYPNSLYFALKYLHRNYFKIKGRWTLRVHAMPWNSYISENESSSQLHEFLSPFTAEGSPTGCARA